MKFNTSTFMLRLAVGVVLFSCEVSFVLGHGFCSAPRVRGAYYTQRPVGNLASEKELGGKFDYCPHCRNAGGVGTLRNAGGNVDESGFWIPYEPLKGKFRNGATLCGDPAGQNDHSASGIFRAPDFKPFAAQYKPGSIASFEYDLTTPHGGYLEFYLCDVGDGDIERSQFTSGKCMQLERAAVEECESGYDSQCGPIDPNFKGRFYLPCRQSPSLDQDQIVGGSNGKMSYKIPNVAIRNGVIQIYWLTANSCNPDGLKEYFTSGKWKQVENSQCEGDGGSRGGFRHDHIGTCSTQHGKFPEEFWNCADVQVVPDVSSGEIAPQTSGSEAENKNDMSPAHEEYKPANSSYRKPQNSREASTYSQSWQPSAVHRDSQPKKHNGSKHSYSQGRENHSAPEHSADVNPCVPPKDPNRHDEGYLSYLKQMETYCKASGRM